MFPKIPAAYITEQCTQMRFFSRKMAKTPHRSRPLQKWRTLLRSNNTRTSLLKSVKASSLFFNLFICVGGICKLFKPKTRIFRLILNSRRVFKNHQYFMVSKSNFGAFFQDMFFLCGITPNHLRLKL